MIRNLTLLFGLILVLILLVYGLGGTDGRADEFDSQDLNAQLPLVAIPKGAQEAEGEMLQRPDAQMTVAGGATSVTAHLEPINVIDVPVLASQFLTGRVMDPSSFGLAASVEVFSVSSFRRVSLGSTSTDLQGHYRLPMQRLIAEIPSRYYQAGFNSSPSDMTKLQLLGIQLEEIDGRDWTSQFRRRSWKAQEIELELCVSSLGFQSATRTLRWSTGGAPQIRSANFRLDPGWNVTAYVIGPRGPVSGAEVRLLDSNFSVVQSTISDQHGKYSISGPPAGDYHLHARRDGVGATVRLNIPFGMPRADGLANLMLDGPARLEGKVVDANGVGLSDMEIEAIPEELARSGDWPIAYGRLLEAERAGGLLHSTAISGEEGRFTIDGLQKGRYVIRFSEQAHGAQPSGEAHRAPKRGIELPWQGHRLTLRATYAGAPLTGCDMRCERILPWSEGLPETGDSLTSNTTASGAAFFTVNPGERYRIRASLGDKRSALEELSIGPYDFQTERTLVLISDNSLKDALLEEPHPPAKEVVLGSLQVTAITQDGIPVKDFGVELSRVGKDAAYAGRPSLDSSGLLTGVPFGTYEVQIFPTSAASLLNAKFKHDKLIQIKSAARRQIELILPASGTIRLSFGSTGSFPRTWDDAPEEVQAQSDWLLAHALLVQTFPYNSSGHASGRTLHFEPSNQTKGRWILPGEAALSITPFLPGEYVLRAQNNRYVNGHRDQIILVKPGETTHAEVQAP